MDCAISVIIPVYNVGAYIKECLDSLLNQTFKNFEVILLNDGSKDNSGTICDQYAKIDNRFRVIHKSNSGVSDTRNLGIKEAVGEYVVFVDSDDTVKSEYLEVLYNAINGSAVDCVICGYKMIRPKRSTDKCVSHTVIIDDIKNSEKSVVSLFREKLLNSPWNKIYRKNKIKDYFDSSLAMGEDLVFNLQYIKECNGIKVVPEVLYNYMVRQGSAVTSYSQNRMQNVVKVNNFLIDYFDNTFSTNESKDEIIQQCIAEVDCVFRHLFRGKNSSEERRMLIRQWCENEMYKEFCKEFTPPHTIFFNNYETIYRYYDRKTWLERRLVKWL